MATLSFWDSGGERVADGLFGVDWLHVCFSSHLTLVSVQFLLIYGFPYHTSILVTSPKCLSPGTELRFLDFHIKIHSNKPFVHTETFSKVLKRLIRYLSAQ